MSQSTTLAAKPAAMCCTITIGGAKVAGRRVGIAWSACGPPVEAPIATTAGARDGGAAGEVPPGWPDPWYAYLATF